MYTTLTEPGRHALSLIDERYHDNGWGCTSPIDFKTGGEVQIKQVGAIAELDLPGWLPGWRNWQTQRT